tara:strand:+ start:1128 stop:2432 length:1305 start_codon:yes stop_codon:yes gene_type:complete
MPTPKKRNNESMLNAAERLIADVAANPYAIYGTSGEGIENLKYLLDGMFRERYGTRATRRVEEAIRDHGAPSYHEEVGMTTRPITVSDEGGLDYRGRRTVKPINQGSVKRINPDLGIIEKYPYMRQERQRLEDAKADEMNAILADLVRNPPRKTVGEGYQNGGTVKYRPGGMMEYPGGGMVPRKSIEEVRKSMMYNEGAMLTGDGDPEKDISPAEALELLAARPDRGGVAYGSTADVARGNEARGYTTAIDALRTPAMAAVLGLGEPSAPRRGDRMDSVAMRGPRVIRNRKERELIGVPKTVKKEEASDDAIYFTPNTSNIRAYTRKDQGNPDAGYRTIGGEKDKFAQGFRSNGKTMYASPEVFEIMKKEGVSPRDPYAIEFMKELAGKNPDLFTKDNKFRSAINSMVMQEVYKDPTERGFLLPADQPVIKASF